MNSQKNIGLIVTSWVGYQTKFFSYQDYCFILQHVFLFCVPPTDDSPLPKPRPLFPGDPYLNFCIAGAVEIPAYALCIAFLNKVGRRWPLVLSMYLGGLACILSGCIPVNGNKGMAALFKQLFSNVSINKTHDIVILHVWVVVKWERLENLISDSSIKTLLLPTTRATDWYERRW